MTYDLAAATAHLRAVEPRFAPLIERHGVPTLTPTRDPFASLGSAIIHQQLAGAAAKTILGRVRALYPRQRFPRPAALAATPLPRLRAAGLSEAKARALHDLAAHFGDRRITARGLTTGDDATVAQLLLPVRGIGPWSVDMFLMFGLCRPDVWRDDLQRASRADVPQRQPAAHRIPRRYVQQQHVQLHPVRDALQPGLHQRRVHRRLVDGGVHAAGDPARVHSERDDLRRRR